MFIQTLSARAGGPHPPPEVMASWPKANHIDPTSHGWSGTSAVFAFLILAIIIFTGRLWARSLIAKNAGLDDLIMGISMIPLIGTTIAVVLANRIYGFQWHVWDQTIETLRTTRQITLAIEVLYLASTCLTKISILCFYRRMTRGSVNKAVVWTIWSLMMFIGAYFFAFSFAVLFTCTPVEGYWHLFDRPWRLQHNLQCNNESAIVVAAVIISTLLDFLIGALPAFVVWNLQIPQRQRIALMALFGMGLITCVCGVLRSYYVIYVYYYTYDITWYAYYGWIWTALEADLGVICASAPALKLFFRRYFNMSSNRYPTSSRNVPRHGTAGSSNALGGTEQVSIDAGLRTIPMDRIAVRTKVEVEERDSIDGRSSSSTRNLTDAIETLPLPPKTVAAPAKPFSSSASDWTGSRTTVTASRTGSRDGWGKDVER